jgi:regulator of replication initiation timing
MNITESIKFDKLQEENEILKKELAEKDRKIDLLLTVNKQITYSTKSRKYNQQKLYKEDFIIGCLYCIQQDKHDKCLPVRYFLKKDSEQKYDKLLSKDVK